MAVATQTARRPSSVSSRGQGRPRLSGRKRAAFVVLINVLVLASVLLSTETAFRVFWNPRYWIHTNRWLVGSGQTEVGKKWWPDTTYTVEGSEFRLEFRTNAAGYRARPDAAKPGHSYRIAFVGDSFTEAMQVPYDSTFCARLEKRFNHDDPSRLWICDNYGISATDLFDYWHRIIHDVLPTSPPDALVLCIYPGNDFQGLFPDDGFDAEGHPLREYFRRPGWAKHLVAWINLHSKFGFFAQRALLSWNAQASRPDPALKNWWTDPELAARLEAAPALQRARAVFWAIDDECRLRGTKLCILVVGPVSNYAAKDGQSPLARILSRWQIDIPVIDLAIKARAQRDWFSLLFPFDGHLNESGHLYVAQEAASPLQAFLASTGLTFPSPSLPEAPVISEAAP